MKIDLAVRHPGPELMDSNDIPAPDLFQNYRELHLVNEWLGGYRITFRGLSQFTAYHSTVSILDIGCGGGDMLKKVALWGRTKKLNLNLKGIDLSSVAIEYSKKNCIGFPEVDLIQQDVFDHLSQSHRYDVIMSCLFMHHFTDDQIINLLSLMAANANMGFIINDLERNTLAYFGINWLTKLFSRSYLVKNDAPLSVRRGFTEEDWWDYFSKALLPGAKISREWAFRHLIVYKK